MHLLKLQHRPFYEFGGGLLLDTCFIIWMAEHHRLRELLTRPIVTTSFNLEELEYVSKHLPDKVREELRHFFKEHHELLILDVAVSPGDRQGEHDFVNRHAPELIPLVPDPSDAVLAAVALVTKSDVLTKDKHHLFTTQLENLFNQRSVHVWKEWKDASG